MASTSTRAASSRMSSLSKLEAFTAAADEVLDESLDEQPATATRERPLRTTATVDTRKNDMVALYATCMPSLSRYDSSHLARFRRLTWCPRGVGGGSSGARFFHLTAVM